MASISPTKRSKDFSTRSYVRELFRKKQMGDDTLVDSLPAEQLNEIEDTILSNFNTLFGKEGEKLMQTHTDGNQDSNLSSELAKKDKELEEARSHIQSLEETLSNLKTEMSSLNSDLKVLKVDKQKLKKKGDRKHSNEEKKISNLKHDKEQLDQVIHQLSEEHIELENKMKETKSENMSLQAQLNMIREAAFMLEQESIQSLALVQDEKQMAEFNFLQIKAERDALIQKQDEFLQELSTLKKNFFDLSEIREKHESELEAANSRLTQIVQEKEAQERQYREQINSLKGEKNNFDYLYTEEHMNNHDLQLKEDESSIHLDELQVRVTQLESEKVRGALELQQELAQVINEKADLEYNIHELKNKNNDLQNSLVDYQNRFAHFQTDLSELSTERLGREEEFFEQVNSLSNEKEDLKSQISRLESDREDLREVIKESSQQTQDIQSQLNFLLLEKARREEELNCQIDNLISEKLLSLESITKLQEENDNLQATLTKTQKKYAISEGEHSVLVAEEREEIKEFEKMISDVERDRQRLEKLLESANAKIESLKKEAQKSQKEIEKAEEQLEYVLSEKQNREASFQKQISELIADSHRNQLAFNNLIEENNTLQTIIEEKEVRIEEAHTQINKISDEKERHEDALHARIEELIDEKEDVIMELNEIQDEKERHEEGLHIRIDELLDEKEDVIMELNDVRDENAELQDYLDEATNRFAEMQGDFAKLLVEKERQEEDFQVRINDITAQKERLEHALNLFTEENEVTENKLKETSYHFTELKIEFTRLREEKELLEKGFVEQVTELTMEKEGLHEVISGLNDINATLMTKIDQTFKKSDALKVQLHQVTELKEKHEREFMRETSNLIVERQRLEDAYEQLKVFNDELQQKAEEVQEQNIDLLGQIVVATGAKTLAEIEAHQKYEELSQSKERIDCAFSGLVEEFSIIKKKLDAVQSENLNLMNQLSIARDEVQVLDYEDEEAGRTIQERSLENEQMDAQLAKVRKELSTLKEADVKHRKEIDEKNKRIEELVEKMATIQVEHAPVKSELLRIKEEMKSQVERNQTLNKELQEAQSQLSSIETKHAEETEDHESFSKSLKEQVASLEEKIASFANEKESHKKEVHKLENKIKKLVNRNDGNFQRIMALEKEQGEYIQELEALKSRNTTLDFEKRRNEGIIKNFEARLQEQKSMNEEVIKEDKAIHWELKDLQYQLNLTQEELKHVRDDKKDLEIKFRNLQNSFDSVKSELEEARNNTEMNHKAVDEVVPQFHKLKEELEAVQDQLTRSVSSNSNASGPTDRTKKRGYSFQWGEHMKLQQLINEKVKDATHPNTKETRERSNIVSIN